MSISVNRPCNKSSSRNMCHWNSATKSTGCLIHILYQVLHFQGVPSFSIYSSRRSIFEWYSSTSTRLVYLTKVLGHPIQARWDTIRWFLYFCSTVVDIEWYTMSTTFLSPCHSALKNSLPMKPSLIQKYIFTFTFTNEESILEGPIPNPCWRYEGDPWVS